jgi:hypothetical protein
LAAAAVVFGEVLAVPDSMEEAADSMAVAEADTAARATRPRLFERHRESVPEGCAD